MFLLLTLNMQLPAGYHLFLKQTYLIKEKVDRLSIQF